MPSKQQGFKLKEVVQDTAYHEQVCNALDEALKRIAQAEPAAGARTFDLSTGRYVILSDHHRGARNAADDFRRCERAYNAAMAYYFRMGYTLVILGDAEELWEERPAPVLQSYDHSLQLEARFHKEHRYIRIWGNHDDAWAYPDLVKEYLGPIFGPPDLQVHEGVRLKVCDDGQELGSILLVHGHQGTSTSDRWAGFSRLVVRYIWRPFQRLTGVSLNTPAKDWVLREKHNVALYSWALRQPGLILIAGHTHRPVFRSKPHAVRVMEQLDELESQLAAQPNDLQLLRRVSELNARLEWVRTQEQQKPSVEGMIAFEKPCYFNTGCCSFLDGDITGLELAEGEIRLVRWPDEHEQPLPDILERASLRGVFAEVNS